MRRREFRKIAGGGIALSPWLGPLVMAADGSTTNAGVMGNSTTTDTSDKTIANAIKNGISEQYDSISGKALGVPDYCMSSTLVTMMLDGLARKHRLKLRYRQPRNKEPL